jgi:hypothetical protein
MASHTADYIPSGDLAFLEWAKNFHSVCTDYATAWGLPVARLATMGAAITNFGNILDICLSAAKTAADTQDKNDQREKLEADCRSFAKEFLLYNSKLTKADLRRVGLHVGDGTYSEIGTPGNVPNFIIELTTIPGRLKLKITDPETGKAAMPYGYNGVVVYYDVLDEPPASEKQLTRSELASASTHYLDFHTEEEGRRAYISVCYENESGERGRCSAIQSSIIP